MVAFYMCGLVRYFYFVLQAAIFVCCCWSLGRTYHRICNWVLY